MKKFTWNQCATEQNKSKATSTKDSHSSVVQVKSIWICSLWDYHRLWRTAAQPSSCGVHELTGSEDVDKQPVRASEGRRSDSISITRFWSTKEDLKAQQNDDDDDDIWFWTYNLKEKKLLKEFTIKENLKFTSLWQPLTSFSIQSITDPVAHGDSQAKNSTSRNYEGFIGTERNIFHFIDSLRYHWFNKLPDVNYYNCLNKKLLWWPKENKRQFTTTSRWQHRATLHPRNQVKTSRLFWVWAETSLIKQELH